MKKQLLFVTLVLALSMVGCTSMEKGDKMMKEGIFLQNGKVMETMDGKTTDLMMDVTLKDGTKIMEDGTVMMKDGTKTMLMEGEFYDFDGMKTMADPMM